MQRLKNSIIFGEHSPYLDIYIEGTEKGAFNKLFDTLIDDVERDDGYLTTYTTKSSSNNLCSEIPLDSLNNSYQEPSGGENVQQ